MTLDSSLKEHGTKYPLVALYTDTFPEEGHKALDSRKIPKKHVAYLLPSMHKDFSNDPRFYDCWSKLTPFSLEEYDRVVQLDSDMLVTRNMDELMDIELDPPKNDGKGNKVFAASHACVCNPLKKPYYPKDWVPENCAFTTQHARPELAQKEGPPPTAGLKMPNGGLQVVAPSKKVYDLILDHLQTSAVANYEFADQSLLGDLFSGRWVALPYTYNALKTLRAIHKEIWRDEEVKNVHYILDKPWDGEGTSPETHRWWIEANERRIRADKDNGIEDGF